MESYSTRYLCTIVPYGVYNVFLQIKPEDSFWTIEDKKNIVVHLEKVGTSQIKINNVAFGVISVKRPT